MNDRFLVVKYMKNFICNIDNMVVNFPRKDFVIKTRIISDSLDVLELIYLGNSIEDNKEIKFNNKCDNYLFLYSSFNNYYNSFKYSNNNRIRRYLKKY